MSKPSQKHLLNLPEKKPGMLGQNGVRTPSTTVWKGKGKERIDVENPNPGQRPGQIHYQGNDGSKYLYDPTTKTFPDAPKAIRRCRTFWKNAFENSALLDELMVRLEFP
jgi:hypothetical protein